MPGGQRRFTRILRLWLWVVAPLALYTFHSEFAAGAAPEPIDTAGYVFTLLSWFGVFGYAYGKAIFTRGFWQAYLPCSVLWDIFTGYREFATVTAVGDGVALLVIGVVIALLLVPQYIGLYLYAFFERQHAGAAASERESAADLARNAVAGLRLLCLLPVSAARFRPGPASLLLGFGLIALIIGAFSYFEESGAIYFDAMGAAVLGSIFFLVVLVAGILCAVRNRVEQLPLLLTALLWAAPVYLIALYGLMQYAWEAEVHPGVWVALAGWGLVALLRAVLVAFGSVRLYELVLVVAVAAMFTQTALTQYLRPDLFYTDPPDAVSVDPGIDQEAVFYRQPKLVARRTGALLPQTPGRADLYFLGFAGNGDQTLFRREVRFAQSLLDRDFGTAGRSLSLVNDREHLATEPLANRHNLRDALRALGRVMDVEDDVLFLFLTSHGGRNAELQVSLYPFDLQGLTGEELRAYLDDSGIQWRVIVISACYSGAFIDALATDQTLIMTASSADATSFGCSDERELTYFGEALFKQELARGRDLPAAFVAAKQALQLREQEEGLEPADPQLYLGDWMATKLRAMGLAGAP